MKPHETTPDALVWRFREIGIEIRFYRRRKHWGGSIKTGTTNRTLPIETIGLLIQAHELERHAT